MKRRDFFIACLLVFSVFADCGQAKGKKWAILVSGGNGYENYSFQSDTCHIYHTLRNGGIPAKNIIHFNYDDAAHLKQNPFPNNLVNIAEGLNVYPGCQIDYRKDEVTPEVFLNVLIGNKTAIKKLIGREGKVLESGPDDNVFVDMDDHGSPGIFFFPGFTMLHVRDFHQALRTMHERRMYKKMMIYLDCCFAGSMFEGFPEDLNIYAVTASNASESAFECCWDEIRNVFVGGVFTTSWAYTVDEADRDEMTLKHLYEKEKFASIANPDPNFRCHPQEFGDLSINQMIVSEFMGSVKNNGKSYKSHKFEDAMQSGYNNKESGIPQFLQRPPKDMVGIATIMRRLMSKDLTDQQRHDLKQELDFSLKVKKFSSDIFMDIAEFASQEEHALTPAMVLTNLGPVENDLCYKEALRLVTSQCPVLEPNRFPFIGRNFHVLINACNEFGREVVANAIKKATSFRHECRKV